MGSDNMGSVTEWGTGEMPVPVSQVGNLDYRSAHSYQEMMDVAAHRYVLFTPQTEKASG